MNDMNLVNTDVLISQMSLTLVLNIHPKQK